MHAYMYAELGCSLMSRLHSCENVIYMEIHCTDKPKRINHQYNTKVYQTVPLTCSSMIQIYMPQINESLFPQHAKLPIKLHMYLHPSQQHNYMEHI